MGSATAGLPVRTGLECAIGGGGSELGEAQSEGRNPKAEGRPKSETRKGAREVARPLLREATFCEVEPDAVGDGRTPWLPPSPWTFNESRDVNGNVIPYAQRS